MTASDYPITFPYGATSDPYSEAHPHRGDDYACPGGTPLVIGGMTVGYTGATGMANGPHLHVQEWQDSVANTRKPQNAFRPGTVVGAGQASQWGNFITIETNGWRTTYAHLSQIEVGKGQVIGEQMIQDTDNEFARWSLTFQLIRGRTPSREEFQASAVGRTWLNALEVLEDDAEAATTQNAQEVGQVAIKDSWEKQIYDLQKENEALKKALSEVDPDSVVVTKNSLWDWFKNLPFIKKG